MTPSTPATPPIPVATPPKAPPVVPPVVPPGVPPQGSAPTAHDPQERVLTVRDLRVWAEDPDAPGGRTELVHGIDLRITRGRRLGIIGESGSGKTLTALAIMGLLPSGLHADGSVLVRAADHELLGADERRLSRLRGNGMSMVFQEPMSALNPTMRVGDQVAETLQVHGRAPDRGAARRRAVELLADVHLPDPAETARAYPHQLSGGQRQRVVLAMALANDPDLLICDEPTTALDVTVQATVLDLIVRGVAERDAGLLFITHDLAVVAGVCDDVAVMKDGRIVESGPVAEVFAHPQHPYTAQLVAASTLDPPQLTAPPQRSPLIRVEDVVKEYPRPRLSLLRPAPPVRALDGVGFDVNEGERLGIVGESGSGKSTLLRILTGLDQPTEGSVWIDGVRIDRLPERRLGFVRDMVQLVLQDPRGSLDPRMTVGESIAEPLRAQRLGNPAEQRARVDEVMTAVGLDPAWASRHPHQFSGGQRQRISIARALAPRPRVLIADEPVSALDVSVRAGVLDLLRRLVDELGLTLVFVSHDLAVVGQLCERVVVMQAGRVVEEGPTAQVFADPHHEYTRRLLASVPRLEGPAWS